jgi:hypothetical protein
MKPSELRRGRRRARQPEEITTRRMSNNETENLGYKSPKTGLREGLAVRTKDIGKEDETIKEIGSARAEGETLKARRPTTMVQKIMRCLLKS